MPEPYEQYPKVGSVASEAGEEQQVQIEIGMIGFSLEDITNGKKGYCMMPLGSRDSTKWGGRRWIRIKLTAMEDIRANRDVIVGDDQAQIKEHTPVELSYEQSAGGYQRVGEDNPLPVTDTTKIFYHSNNNPVKVLENYSSAGVAPHAATARWVYTCPAGKQAFIEHLTCFTVRITASSAAAFSTCYIKVSHGADDAYPLEARIYSIAIGAQQIVATGTHILLNEGDVIVGYTSDASADGTVGFIISAMITEFDAE